MRISDWSSDVCSSDLLGELPLQALEVDERLAELTAVQRMLARQLERVTAKRERTRTVAEPLDVEPGNLLLEPAGTEDDVLRHRSVEHTYELPSLMPNSYAVLCMKQKHSFS